MASSFSRIYSIIGFAVFIFRRLELHTVDTELSGRAQCVYTFGASSVQQMREWAFARFAMSPPNVYSRFIMCPVSGGQWTCHFRIALTSHHSGNYILVCMSNPKSIPPMAATLFQTQSSSSSYPVMRCQVFTGPEYLLLTSKQNQIKYVDFSWAIRKSLEVNPTHVRK